VEDRRPHLLETLDGDGLPVEALLAEEEHGDVGRVVQGQAHAEDEDDGGHDLK